MSISPASSNSTRKRCSARNSSNAERVVPEDLRIPQYVQQRLSVGPAVRGDFRRGCHQDARRRTGLNVEIEEDGDVEVQASKALVLEIQMLACQANCPASPHGIVQTNPFLDLIYSRKVRPHRSRSARNEPVFFQLVVQPFHHVPGRCNGVGGSKKEGSRLMPRAGLEHAWSVAVLVSNYRRFPSQLGTHVPDGLEAERPSTLQVGRHSVRCLGLPLPRQHAHALFVAQGLGKTYLDRPSVRHEVEGA
ncbi:hypothetical protein DFO63_4145 [Stenotrophomonas sp. AG209]|nr:hypothetical protein DFO63_4145 [Stenotrophomonas sp. AG209]